ncbi:cobalt-precorrin-5B (C(1))-methyltransferase [Gammaproteobacteria bacterium]|nr:cobalt-precorrin-5B (C(1))-methyltransferase [Gammaproteobacteria bacterium]
MKKNKVKKTDEDTRELRRGWTTGACATAAAKASYIGLITGQIPSNIQITLPGGKTPSFLVHDSYISLDDSMAAIEKDAGDDPDVTHGSIVRVTIRRAEELIFKAGEGVGKVTKPGLPIEVGEPAINPGPRKMIEKNLRVIANKYGLKLNIEVEISIDNGAALAQKTWNPRLGILGGLSILGTTGIVIPYSCAAWIASIHQGIDVARATGIIHVAACTGKTSEEAVTALYGFKPSEILDMGDFVGATVKYLQTNPIPKVTIASGFGKITKLAAGHMDLHSKRSQVDPKFIASLAAKGGIDKNICEQISKAESAGNIIELIEINHLKLGNDIAEVAQNIISRKNKNNVDFEVLVYNRKGIQIGHAPFKKSNL